MSYIKMAALQPRSQLRWMFVTQQVIYHESLCFHLEVLIVTVGTALVICLPYTQIVSRAEKANTKGWTQMQTWWASVRTKVLLNSGI